MKKTTISILILAFVVSISGCSQPTGVIPSGCDEFNYACQTLTEGADISLLACGVPQGVVATCPSTSMCGETYGMIVENTEKEEAYLVERLCGEQTDPSYCQDSDQGKIYDLKGVVTGLDYDNVPFEAIDSCASENQLGEYFCIDRVMDLELYTCPIGRICLEGACTMGGSGCTESCDDGKYYTIDTCKDEKCYHELIQCPVGKYVDLMGQCIDNPCPATACDQQKCELLNTVTCACQTACSNDQICNQEGSCIEKTGTFWDQWGIPSAIVGGLAVVGAGLTALFKRKKKRR